MLILRIYYLRMMVGKTLLTWYQVLTYITSTFPRWPLVDNNNNIINITMFFGSVIHYTNS